MEDKTSSFVPSDTEKLSHKYILDAILRRRREATELAVEVVAEAAESSTTVEERTEPVPTELAAATSDQPDATACGSQPTDAVAGPECSGADATDGNPEPTEAAQAAEPPRQPTLPAPIDLPAGKGYFRIGEVADLLGVEPHVLRYWETEFTMIRPTKSGGQRVYRRKDVETLHQIRHLLHVEGLAIRQARRFLREKRREAVVASATQTVTPVAAAPSEPVQVSAELLKEVAQELRALIRLAQGNPGA